MSLAARCGALPLVARRFIALGIVPALLAAAVFAVYWPVANLYQAQQAWRAEVRDLLARAGQAPSLEKSLQQELQAVRESPLRARFYASRPSLPTPAALQADTRALFDGLQVSGLTLTPIAPEEMKSFVRHGIKVAASIRVNQLQQVLAAAAAQPRFLQIGRLNVVSPQIQVPEENPPLAVTMEVYGYELLATPRVAAAPAGG